MTLNKKHPHAQEIELWTQTTTGGQMRLWKPVEALLIASILIRIEDTKTLAEDREGGAGGRGEKKRHWLKQEQTFTLEGWQDFHAVLMLLRCGHELKVNQWASL